MSSRALSFQVDIAGIIEIMGSSLYSRPEVAIRELLQNAHDAVMRRRQQELDYHGRIDVRLDPQDATLSFTDDGIGLSVSDAENYLSTLGVGIAGLLKGRRSERGVPLDLASGDGADLIGQFGIGLFSGFMLADRLVVCSRERGQEQGVRWSARLTPGVADSSPIQIEPIARDTIGTTVTLHLKPEHRSLSQDAERLEKAIREFADFLPVPIHLDDAPGRCNVIHVAWFEPTADRDAIELELTTQFDEAPLDVIPIRVESPVPIAGALYVTPQRTPGFAGEPVVTVTIRHMVISRRIDGLLPEWASFLRGVLELADCSPTASREDLVRDASFENARTCLERILFDHFEEMAIRDPLRLESILTWHRYTWAGAALNTPRLRALLGRSYHLPTSRGRMTFEEILEASAADPVLEPERDRVVWFNGDRRQEAWIDGIFHGSEVPCVHALRTFEESLLGAWVADARARGVDADLRLASPGSPGFAAAILGVHDLVDAPPEWSDFLAATGARVRCATFSPDRPVLAFLDEDHELRQTFDQLRSQGAIPSGFQRMIDGHFDGAPVRRNEIVLNMRHQLVSRSMAGKTSSPLASTLRLLVAGALATAGATPSDELRRQQEDDLQWIAEALWSK